MSYKYLNYGDYRLLSAWNTVFNVYEKERAPRTGKAFYNEGISRAIKLPEDTKEVWFRITVSSSYASSAYVGFKDTALSNGSYTAFVFETNSSNPALYVKKQNSTYYTFYPYSINNLRKMIQNFDIFTHIFSDANNGRYEVYINGTKYVDFTGNIMSGNAFVVYEINSYGRNVVFSDIILSTEEFNLNEHCALLPIKLVTTDGFTWDEVNNVYYTDSIDKSLIQTIDVDKFIEQIGMSDPTITKLDAAMFNTKTSDAEVIDKVDLTVENDNGTDTALLGSTNITTTSKNYGKLIQEDLNGKNPLTNENWTVNDLRQTKFKLTTAKQEVVPDENI